MIYNAEYLSTQQSGFKNISTLALSKLDFFFVSCLP